ncbi:MAG TPA: hypothetical protein VIJ65_02520 [Acidobacteriaceae bacterium]
MKRFCMSVCALTCFAALALPCMAQANPWNGSWKIDPATVKYDGPTFSVATDAHGFTVTRDGKASPKMVCDGQPQKEEDGATTTCVQSHAGYVIDATRKGETSRMTLSVAGKTLTRKVEVSPAGGSPFTITQTSKRVSGGPGFAGVWKTTHFDESQDTGILTIEVTGDSVALKETDNDKPIVCKLDGTPSKFGEGRTISVKEDGSHTLKVTYRGDDGKLQRENTFVLSPNGKTVKETDVTPAPSSSTMSMLFHKS